MTSEPDTAGNNAPLRVRLVNPTRHRGASSALHPVIGALSILAAVVAAHFSDLRWLAERWLTLGNESHGLLVGLLVPCFVWQRRAQLEPSAVGRGTAFVALAVLELAYAYAKAANVDAARLALLPAIAIAGVGTALGARAARILAPSIGVFVFAVPLWDVLTPLLQQITVLASTLMLSAVGVPAHIDGNLISIPAGTFEVVGGCSGTNYFVVALATSATLALVNRFGAARSLRLAAFAAATALIANWVRVTTIVCVGHATQMRSALVEQHIGFGWLVFAVAMVPVFWVATRLRPNAHSSGVRSPPVRCSLAWLAVAIAAPFAFSKVLALSEARNAGALAVRWVVPVERLEAGGSGDWRPEFPGAAVAEHVLVTTVDATVDVYVAAYARQERGRELVGSRSTLGGVEWTERWTRIVPAHGPGSADVRETLLERGAEQRLAWSWFDVRGTREVAPWRLKVREGMAVFGAERRSAIVAISTACRPDCAAARETLGGAVRAGLADVRVISTDGRAR